jgi:hypothetical protein
MAEINKRLLRFNPGLQGSQITNDHMSEVESSNLNKQNLKMLNDDTRSVISMSSNLTGFSRKSGVSMIDLDSIVSIGELKKLPGERVMAENAKRRAEKAQLASIEANLKRI